MKITFLFLSLFLFSFSAFSQNSDQLSQELEKFQKENATFLKAVEANKGNPAFLLKAVLGDKKQNMLGENGMEGLLRGALIPFRGMSDEQLKAFLLEQVKGTFAYDFLLSNPRILLFAAKMLKDKEALPSLAKILSDRQRLILFIVVNVLIIIIAWLVKRFQHRQKRTLLASLRLWIWRALCVNLARLGVLIFFFHLELAPTWSLFREIFF